jgi:hypothetical protein
MDQVVLVQVEQVMLEVIHHQREIQVETLIHLLHKLEVVAAVLVVLVKMPKELVKRVMVEVVQM